MIQVTKPSVLSGIFPLCPAKRAFPLPRATAADRDEPRKLKILERFNQVPGSSSKIIQFHLSSQRASQTCIPDQIQWFK